MVGRFSRSVLNRVWCFIIKKKISRKNILPTCPIKYRQKTRLFCRNHERVLHHTFHFGDVVENVQSRNTGECNYIFLTDSRYNRNVFGS